MRMRMGGETEREVMRVENGETSSDNNNNNNSGGGDDDSVAPPPQGSPQPALVISGQRLGTTASARFNILSTMVGGGSLSLPMAFQKAGNGLMGPVILLIVAVVTNYCFHILIYSARTLSPVSPHQIPPGKDSFESIASAAFGKRANVFSMGLVTSMCFFGAVGYAVLLRDMLMPITELVFQLSTPQPGPTTENNIIMLTVVVLVTPLCTLKTLTALKRFGAASMFSVFILGSCIVYRSLQCNLGGSTGSNSGLDIDMDMNMDNADRHWWDAFQLWPDSWKDVLDAFPLFISCYVCHYNLLPVHNEFHGPSQERVSWWLSSTAGYATAFYMVIGLAGSAYGHCTESGTVQGNVLLDFPDDDPLLLVGRMCLAITITLAFPMLTIPARDILISILPASWYTKAETSTIETTELTVHPAQTDEEELREPLLESETALHAGAAQDGETGTGTEPESVDAPASFRLRLVVVVIFFWSGALVASCVSSIDVVWALLGSSLSILLSHLIPCASFLVISGKAASGDPGRTGWRNRVSRAVAWLLIVVFTPLMFLSTGNAVYDTFFRGG